MSVTCSFSAFDHQMMARAIQLAQRGIYTTAPNPNVGCVITLNDNIIGEGAHLRAGDGHAEVHALAAVARSGQSTHSATAYVTLEPCSHYGRTPPCAEALIKAKVARVVCAMQDPNPQVAGRGIQMLRDAGIQVDVGLLESEAMALNPGFIKRMQTGMPFVQLKLAASLDGKTALKNGQSQWITGSHARQDVQVYRAQAGAILSTSKTVLDDNATLNVRHADLPLSVQTAYPQDQIRQPTRVILNRNNSLFSADVGDLKLFKSDGDVLIVNANDGFSSSLPCLAEEVAQVEQIQAPLGNDGQFDLNALLVQLAKLHNINHLWVEAGATLAASFIEQGLVDELIIYLAPKLMGTDGRGLTQITGLESMQQAMDLTIKDLRMVGADIRITATITKR